MSERIIYDGTDLLIDLNEKVKELETALNDLMSGGVTLALAERDYKITLRKHSLLLKDYGYTATMIDKTILGVDEVAEARYKRDVAEAIYEAKKERINCTKLEIRVLEAQIEREYGKYVGGGV